MTVRAKQLVSVLRIPVKLEPSVKVVAAFGSAFWAARDLASMCRSVVVYVIDRQKLELSLPAASASPTVGSNDGQLEITFPSPGNSLNFLLGVVGELITFGAAKRSHSLARLCLAIFDIVIVVALSPSRATRLAVRSASALVATVTMKVNHRLCFAASDARFFCYNFFRQDENLHNRFQFWQGPLKRRDLLGGSFRILTQESVYV